MSINFPTTLDDATSIPVESAGTALATNHVTAHQNIQDALEAVEAKVGVDGSAVTTSHDYKLGEVTSTDKAVGKTATQTLTNKTLTAPTITSPKVTVGSDAVGDLHYVSNVDGTLSRLAIGTDNYILKVNGTALNWEAETVTVNADQTTAGIVEEATAAEITAGTATGGTGASLYVTPDQLALSTPVFDGSGLTAIPRFLTSGAPAETTSNTTETVLTYALAGGILSTNKGVRIRVAVQSAISATNSGASYTLKYGATTLCTFGYAGSSGTPTVTAVTVADIILMGSGATGTQRTNSFVQSVITSGSGGAQNGAVVQTGSSSIDSTTSQDITIECVAGANVTGTLLDYFIEKIV